MSTAQEKLRGLHPNLCSCGKTCAHFYIIQHKVLYINVDFQTLNLEPVISQYVIGQIHCVYKDQTHDFEFSLKLVYNQH